MFSAASIIRCLVNSYTKEASNLPTGAIKAIGGGAALGGLAGVGYGAYKGEPLHTYAPHGLLAGGALGGLSRAGVNRTFRDHINNELLRRVREVSPSHEAAAATMGLPQSGLGNLVDTAVLGSRQGLGDRNLYKLHQAAAAHRLGVATPSELKYLHDNIARLTS